MGPVQRPPVTKTLVVKRPGFFSKVPVLEVVLGGGGIFPSASPGQASDVNIREPPEKSLHRGNEGTGGILFREYCFENENSLSSALNSLRSAPNLLSFVRSSVSLPWHTDNRLRGTH